MGNPLTKQVTQQRQWQSHKHRDDVLWVEEWRLMVKILVDLWKYFICHRNMQTEYFFCMNLNNS